MKCESTTKHSLFLQKFVKLMFASALVLFILFIQPKSAAAQMFSVGDENPRMNIPKLEFFVAFEPMTVSYEGENNEFQTAPFAFEGPVLRLGYNSPTLDLSLGTGGKITGLDEVSYFDFGGNIDVGFSLYKTGRLVVRLPVQIASRFTNITNSNRINDRFRFGSLTAGAGVKLFTRPLENFRLQAGVIPSYGFSFASGGVFGGSLGSVEAGGKIYLDRLFDDVGLSLGYKYKIRNYDIDEETYDYKMTANSIQVGITF